MKQIMEKIITIPAVYYDSEYAFTCDDSEVERIDNEIDNRLNMVIDVVMQSGFFGLECDSNFGGKLFLHHSKRSNVDYQLSRLDYDGYFSGHADLMISDFKRNDYSCEGLYEISKLSHNKDLILTVLYTEEDAA